MQFYTGTKSLSCWVWYVFYLHFDVHEGFACLFFFSYFAVFLEQHQGIIHILQTEPGDLEDFESDRLSAWKTLCNVRHYYKIRLPAFHIMEQLLIFQSILFRLMKMELL